MTSAYVVLLVIAISVTSKKKSGNTYILGYKLLEYFSSQIVSSEQGIVTKKYQKRSKNSVSGNL